MTPFFSISHKVYNVYSYFIVSAIPEPKIRLREKVKELHI